MELSQFYKDKGERSDKGTIHCYIDEWYSSEFTPIRYENLKILEIGINKGDSLILWRDWFTNSEITGIDNMSEMGDDYINIVDKIERVNIIYADAYSPFTSDSFEDNTFDYIIDDGPHSLLSQLLCIKLYYSKLKSGGKIIIEDISDIDNFKIHFDKLNIPYTIVDLREKSKHKQKNDVLLIFEK